MTQTNAIEWYDTFEDTKERKIITGPELGIPGLRMFGSSNTTRATAPLVSHYHKSCFEFTYVVQGSIRFSVKEKSYSLSGGDMYVTFPDEVHDTGCAPLSLHQIYWFQLETDHPEDFLFMDPAAARDLLELLQGLSTRVIKMNDRWTSMILAKTQENIRKNTHLGRMQAGYMLSILLYHILESAELPSFRITPDIGRATEHILHHLHEDLLIEKLAQISLLSTSRFKQKFKSQLGVSPRNFINFHKIEEAKKLLLSGKNVTDTAMELSFSNSNYFSSVFRRYTSLSPTEYVRQMRAARALPGDETGQSKQ